VDNRLAVRAASGTLDSVTDPDDLPERVARLEREVPKARADAAAARFLAGCADRDVSELKAELQSHKKVLEALRETQLEQGQEFRARLTNVENEMHESFAEMHESFAEMHEGFAEVHGGFAEVHGGFAEMREGFAEMRHGFSMMDTRMAEVTTRLTSVEERLDES
jgi:chromosome segregation ATPase